MSWLSPHVTLPNLLILVGGLIAGAGALWASIQQTKYEHELRQKSEEIAALNHTMRRR